MQERALLRTGTPAGRWVIAATVLGSGIAFLDSTVVNVALPSIQEDLGGGLAGLQWTMDAYLVTLGSLMLLGGSLGDIFGRKKLFVWGLAGFAVASALCGIAPSIEMLIGARALQGVAAAMLVPGSLAIIQASFAPEDRARAIGAWSGLSGVTTAIGPFLGGWMVDADLVATRVLHQPPDRGRRDLDRHPTRTGVLRRDRCTQGRPTRRRSSPAWASAASCTH